MKKLQKTFIAVTFVAGVRALTAYLDPGSGSLIVQLLVAAIVGLLATFRLWKNRLLSLFGIKREVEDDSEDLDMPRHDD